MPEEPDATAAEEKLLDVLSVRIGPTLREALEREARYLDCSLSTHIRKVLEAYARGRSSSSVEEGTGRELLETVEGEMRELLTRLARRVRAIELARRRGKGQDQ